ncbi:hypothetical protein P5673_026541 [Acropora cervicornis]|uniref:Uncharacterized protein n=1 Tax=Acropora cervicornis TaxID=6130 RepID=A0AAD9UWE1_ACRCE|nr:hypothetical protein P5673_026541 [Acropora cervicornis]
MNPSNPLKTQANRCLPMPLSTDVTDCFSLTSPSSFSKKWIRRRNEKGHFENIVKDLMIEDTAGYKEMMRMNYDDFTTILGIIEPYIMSKQILGGTKVIKAPERLTLVFNAMKEHFLPKYVRIPSTDEEWMQIADKFEKKAELP